MFSLNEKEESPPNGGVHEPRAEWSEQQKRELDVIGNSTSKEAEHE